MYVFPFLSFSFFFLCNTGVWTQGLHLEPLNQASFVMDFFQDRVSWTVCLGWIWTRIILISASWVGRITGVIHQCPANICFLSFLSLIRIYSLYRGDSLWQCQIGLYCTLVSSPPLSLPLNLLPVPLKAVVRGFFVLVYVGIWNPPTIYPHLDLLHPPSHLPQATPSTHCTCFTVLSFIIKI
jgi:hypothetical protein